MLSELSLRARRAPLGQDMRLEDRTLLSGAAVAGRTWTVTASDENLTSWSASTLVFTSQADAASGGLDLEGHFDWVRDGTPAGQELFHGELSADRLLTLEGYDVSSPAIAPAHYRARLDAAGDAFTDGVWFGTGVIAGTWSATAPPAPTLRVFEGAAAGATQQQTFLITPAVRMPALTFELTGLPAGVDTSSLAVTWTTAVEYRPGAGTPPGAKAVSGFGLSVARTGTRYQPVWPAVRGGDIDVTARFTLGGVTYAVSTESSAATAGIQILGSNPTRSQVQKVLAGYRPPANWPAGSGYVYGNVLRQIAYHETNVASIGPRGYNQFYRSGPFAGHPAWNSGGDGGVGLMQVTTDPVVPANVWDWKANVAAGVRAFNDKLRVAATYPRTITTSASFRAAVTRYNEGRTARGLPPVRVSVPAWTPQQRVLVAVRAYNGAAGTDSIGTPILNEYDLAVGPGGLLSLKVNAQTRVGLARWVRVAPGRRPVNPNYVQQVLASPLT